MPTPGLLLGVSAVVPRTSIRRWPTTLAYLGAGGAGFSQRLALTMISAWVRVVS